MLQLLQQVLPLIGLDPDQAQGKVDANGDYYGAGYGIMTPATVNALQQTARAEGILLDPVYTGKAMAGLMDLCQRGIIDQGSRQLFVHTGGSPALAGYASVL